jgi:hypothetical protein
MAETMTLPAPLALGVRNVTRSLRTPMLSSRPASDS